MIARIAWKESSVAFFIFPHWSFGQSEKIILQRFSRAPARTFCMFYVSANLHSRALAVGVHAQQLAGGRRSLGGTRALEARQSILLAAPKLSQVKIFSGNSRCRLPYFLQGKRPSFYD